MEFISLKKSVLKWFRTYLLNKKLFWALEGVFSDAGLINFAVPQGSIFLFPNFSISLSLYFLISDLPQELNKTGSHLCANNTCIFYESTEVEKITKIFNKEFLSLCQWFIDKKVISLIWK